MRIFLILITTLSIIFVAKGQQSDSINIIKNYKNDINVEAASIVFYSVISVNYERLLKSKNGIAIIGSLGIGTWKSSGGAGGDTGHGGWSIRPAIILITDKKPSKLEFDIGLSNTIQGKSFTYPLLKIGYRYQKKHVLFRTLIGTEGIEISSGFVF